MKEEFTIENKIRWISRIYFSVSDSYNHDVNPYDEVQDFLNAKVNSMNWGSNKKESKDRFAEKFLKILDLYDIILPKAEVLSALEKEDNLNKDIIKKWASIA